MIIIVIAYIKNNCTKTKSKKGQDLLVLILIKNVYLGRQVGRQAGR